MEKKFKNILLFSSILGLGAITASSIALTSCSNVDNTKPSTPGDPNNPSITPPNTNIPDSDGSISGGNNQDSSQEETPIVLPTLDERQRAIIKNSPTLS